MSDSVGTLSLPVAAPTVYPPADRTRAPGDPALVQLGTFAATVLQADCGAAWTALDRGRRDQPGAVDGTRAGSNVVRSVHYSDPRLGYFEPDVLPGVFVWRSKIGKWSWAAANCQRRTGQITVAWLPPRAEADPQRRERDPFTNAVYASLFQAFSKLRHPAWVTDADRADLDGLLVAFATSTSVQTISSFTGALAGQTMVAARPISITTTAAPGAYNTTDPIVVTGLLKGGASFVERVYLTDPDGGETITTIFPFSSPTSVRFPAMVSTAGTIAIGYSDSPDVRKGSLIQPAAGCAELHPSEGVYSEIRVRQPNADPMPFMAMEFPLYVEEDLAPSTTLLFDPWDVEAHGTTTDGDEVFEIVIEE